MAKSGINRALESWAFRLTAKETDVAQSHSIDEAHDRHARKRQRRSSS